jgi:hypothetical protein
MDSQSFDYWVAQGNCIAAPHQTTIFELPPDLSKVPSLSGSPVRIVGSLHVSSINPAKDVLYIRSISYIHTSNLLPSYRRRTNAIRVVPHANDPFRLWFGS